MASHWTPFSWLPRNDTRGSKAVRSANNVEILVRVVGNNEFVTLPFNIPATCLRYQHTFYDAIHDVVGPIIGANMFQSSLGQDVSIRLPYITLLQETGSSKHGMLHVRWSTLTPDPSAATHWESWYDRNIVWGATEKLLVEVHFAWQRADHSRDWWTGVFEPHLRAAGRGYKRIQEKPLKRVIIEENGHRIENDWNTERWMPRRAPVRPREGCELCRVAAEQLGSLKNGEGFRKLRRLFDAGVDYAAILAKLSAEGMAKKTSTPQPAANASIMRTPSGSTADIPTRTSTDEPADVEMSG